MSVLDNALQTLFKLGIEVKRVWKNASPTSTFAAQDIAVADITDCDFVLFLHSTLSNGTILETVSDLVPTELPNPALPSSQLTFGSFCQTGTATSTRGYNGARRVGIKEDKISFSGGLRTTDGPTGPADNKVCIPYEIYTIKFIGGGNRIARFIKSLFHVRERGWA